MGEDEQAILLLLRILKLLTILDISFHLKRSTNFEKEWINGEIVATQESPQ